jgi:4,5-DOPA dioxygenase extradiol
MPTPDDYKILTDLPSTDTMPLIFVGHGSPMNAITDNAFTRGWVAVGEVIPRPQAILCVSAHWLTPGSTQVTAMEVPKTIHDFGGFPKELFEQEYPARDTPEYAEKTIDLIRKTEVTCPPRTDPTLELEFWNRRKGRYVTQEVHT